MNIITRSHSKCANASLAILTAGILSITMLPIQAFAAADTPAALPGDVNGDGAITAVDAYVLQGWLLGHDNVDVYAPKNADANGDGKVNAADFSYIKRAVLTGNQPQTPPVTPASGKLYHKLKLVDQQAGITAFAGILPDGWTAQLQSNWAVINNYPAQESVTLTSPDGKAVVTITSPQMYTQSSLRGNGASISEYTTYFTYLNAEAFIDYYVSQTFAESSFIKELEIPKEQSQFVSDFALLKAQTFASYLQMLQNVNWQVTGYEGTVSRRQYQTDGGISEFCCAIAAFEHINVTGLLTNDSINWETLNTVGFIAADKEAFETYYSDYEIITANSYFTADFYSARNYVADRIAQAIADSIISESSGLNASGDYSKSGIEVSANDRETQERVFQAWDDYIKDEDRYTTQDGSTFTTSMYNETVAQDGDSFYVGSYNDVPDGYTVLTKT